MICLHQKYKIFSNVRGLELCLCPSCGIIRVFKEKYENPREIYDDYYQEETGGRFNFKIEYIVKIFRFLRALKLFFFSPYSRSILDIGSGRGWTLFFLKKYFHFKVAVGTQISQNAYRFSREKLNLEIYNQDFLEINFERSFDLISLWHVLEHVNSPEEYVEKISRLLPEGGKLFIEVPNYNAWTRKLSLRHWLGLDLKHHLTFFTPRSLSDLLMKYGLEIKKIRTFSLEYSTFTSTQSLVNIIFNSEDYFFRWIQGEKFGPNIIFHAVVFFLLMPICFLVSIFLCFSPWGEVISITAEKNET